MKKIYLFIAILPLILQAQVPQWEWARNVSNTYTNQTVVDLCTDDSSNVFIHGINYAQSSFDQTSIEPGHFLAKCNKDGQYLWAKKLHCEPVDIQCDHKGNVYAVGTFSGNITEGAWWAGSNGATDIFILKISDYGNISRLQSFGGESSDYLGSCIVGRNNDLYITGSFKDSIWFGTNHLIAKPNALNTGSQFYLTKLTENGSVTWCNTGPDSLDATGGGCLCIDNQQNIFCSGSALRNPCPWICSYNFISKYGKDGALQKYTTDVWSEPTELKTDPTNNLYLLGLDQFNTTNNRKLEKYNSSLETKWRKDIDDTYGCFNLRRGLSIDDEGYPYIFGLVGKGGYASCDSIQIGTKIKRKGLVDLLITKFDQQGEYVSSINEGLHGCVGCFYSATCFTGDMAMDRSGHLFISTQYNMCDGLNKLDSLNLGNDTIFSDGTWGQSFLAKLKVKEVVAGEKENQSISKIAIYPNPSPGIFSISNINEPATACVYDVQGKRVCTISIKQNKIDLSLLNKGIYFLLVNNEEGVFRKKIVIE
jgi:hypothetical protein